MLYVITVRNNETGAEGDTDYYAKSKVNARRLSDRVRKHFRKRGYRHITVGYRRIR